MRDIKLESKRPDRVADISSAWAGLESVLEYLILKFGVKKGKAIEFGVERGYSTVALSNFFKEVVGVDTFNGDIHSGKIANLEKAQEICKYPNIKLIESDYKDFNTKEKFDFAHVDIIHTYKDTYACGQKALDLSPIVVFHDTESFPDVKRAVVDLAKNNNKKVANYPHFYGLGIIY